MAIQTLVLPGPVPDDVGLIAVGADAGNLPLVTVYDRALGGLRFEFMPFGPSFRGGVRVALGDVNGDGVPDVIAAAGPGGGPQVVVYDGRTGQFLGSFNALSPSFSGGLTVSTGDIFDQGYDDIIVGAGAGGGPQVTVFDGHTFQLLASFYGMAPSFTGGVSVAVGDTNGDGRADIVVGAGAGGGPQVTIFDGSTLRLLASFYALSPSFTNGISVAVGDVNGDGIADIIVGAGAGGGPQVTLFDGKSLQLLASFFADAATFTGGYELPPPT